MPVPAGWSPQDVASCLQWHSYSPLLFQIFYCSIILSSLNNCLTCSWELYSVRENVENCYYPQCLGTATEGWMLHSQDPTIPLLPQPPLYLQLHSARTTSSPPVPPHLFQGCAPFPNIGTLISLEWQGRVWRQWHQSRYILMAEDRKNCVPHSDMTHHRERSELWCSCLWVCCLLKQAGVQISSSVSVLFTNKNLRCYWKYYRCLLWHVKCASLASLL